MNGWCSSSHPTFKLVKECQGIVHCSDIGVEDGRIIFADEVAVDRFLGGAGDIFLTIVPPKLPLPPNNRKEENDTVNNPGLPDMMDYKLP